MGENDQTPGQAAARSDGTEKVRTGAVISPLLQRSGPVADLVFIATIVAFFGLAMLLVRACERIIGAYEEATTPAASTPTTKLAA